MFKLSVAALAILATFVRPAPEDKWFVKFADNPLDSGLSRAEYIRQALGGDILDSTLEIKEWNLPGLDAVAAEFTQDQLEIIKALPDVDYIQPNVKYSISQGGSQTNPGSWGIDRVDGGLDGRYNFPGRGNGVDVYVIDTGIDTRHRDFGGRARWGFNAADNSNTDGNGHGTHVAGTVASTTYGVAKGATVWAVKVLDNNGDGFLEWIMDGVNWVTRNASRGSVANMSLGDRGRGGPNTRLMDDAVAALIRSGTTVVIAAGNETQDACNVSPARVGAAITVGSTARGDTISNFSNWGRCVDILAPGSAITSTIPGNRASTISGTSMAAPHVAGVAALVLEGRSLSPAAVAREILNSAERNQIGGSLRGSPNLFVSNQ